MSRAGPCLDERTSAPNVTNELRAKHHLRHSLAETEAVVLAAVLWVDVGHVGEEHPRQRGAMRWQAIEVTSGNDRLCERGAKDPVLLDPARVELGPNALDGAEVAAQHVGVGLAEQRMVHRQVIA